MSAAGHGSALDRLARELEEPVARLGASGWSAERLRILLGRAELRAWQIESIDMPGVLAGRCPLGSGRAMLAFARPLSAEPVPGTFVVARAIPVAPGRWALLGRGTVVAPATARGFERLLASLRAPRGEFWRVHGGVLAQAARAA